MCGSPYTISRETTLSSILYVFWCPTVKGRTLSGMDLLAVPKTEMQCARLVASDQNAPPLLNRDRDLGPDEPKKTSFHPSSSDSQVSKRGLFE